MQKHHIALLPALPARAAESDLPVVHHHVADTVEGWSDALHALLVSFQDGTKVEFDYSAIRSRGAPLKTSGGKAPGHLPLKKALSRVEHILDGVVRDLEPWDLLRIMTDIGLDIYVDVLASDDERGSITT